MHVTPNHARVRYDQNQDIDIICHRISESLNLLLSLYFFSIYLNNKSQNEFVVLRTGGLKKNVPLLKNPLTYDRNLRPRWYKKKMFLKKLIKFTAGHTKKRNLHKCFDANFAKFLKLALEQQCLAAFVIVPN